MIQKLIIMLKLWRIIINISHAKHLKIDKWRILHVACIQQEFGIGVCQKMQKRKLEAALHSLNSIKPRWVFPGQLMDEVCKKASPFKISHTYPTMMKLSTVRTYLKKFQKHINQVTHPSSFGERSYSYERSYHNLNFIRVWPENFFFEGCSWFRLSKALDMILNFDTSMAKVLKIKVRKFFWLIRTFVEGTVERLVEVFLTPPLPATPYPSSFSEYG